MRAKSVIVLALIAMALPCRAAQWFAVSGPRNPATLVEVDLDTLTAHAHGGEAVIRVSYGGMQRHEDGFDYRSFLGTARLDCEQHRIAVTTAVYYALPRGGGQRLDADSAKGAREMSGALVRSIPEAERVALLRATCAMTRPAS